MGCNTSRELVPQNPYGFRESDENESARVCSPTGEPIGAEMVDPDVSYWNEDDQCGQTSSRAFAKERTRQISMPEESQSLEADIDTASLPPGVAEEKPVQAEAAEEVLAGACKSEDAASARSPSRDSARLTPAMAEELGKMERALQEAAVAETEEGAGIVTKEKEGAVAMYVPSGADVNAAAIVPACVQRRPAKPTWKTAYDIDQKLMIASAFRQENLNKRKESARLYEKRRSETLRRRELVTLLGPDGALMMTATEPSQASATASPKSSAAENPKASPKTRTKATAEEGAKSSQHDSDHNPDESDVTG